MSAYTPGPWKAIEWTCHAPTTVVTDIGLVVAECTGHGRDASESLGDARLIAAAPELLEALEKMMQLYDSALTGPDPQSRPQEFAQIARAAIRKAVAA
jgi:hypothetical protein